jgi:hypothetical protein
MGCSQEVFDREMELLRDGIDSPFENDEDEDEFLSPWMLAENVGSEHNGEDDGDVEF